jgi:hypothetical protein
MAHPHAKNLGMKMDLGTRLVRDTDNVLSTTADILMEYPSSCGRRSSNENFEYPPSELDFACVFPVWGKSGAKYN